MSGIPKGMSIFLQWQKDTFLHNEGLNRLLKFEMHFTLEAEFERERNVIPCL